MAFLSVKRPTSKSFPDLIKPSAIDSMGLRNTPFSLGFSIALKGSFNGDGTVISYLNSVRTTKADNHEQRSRRHEPS
jgi:hypothetical protein